MLWYGKKYKYPSKSQQVTRGVTHNPPTCNWCLFSPHFWRLCFFSTDMDQRRIGRGISDGALSAWVCLGAGVNPAPIIVNIIINHIQWIYSTRNQLWIMCIYIYISLIQVCPKKEIFALQSYSGDGGTVTWLHGRWSILLVIFSGYQVRRPKQKLCFCFSRYPAKTSTHYEIPSQTS